MDVRVARPSSEPEAEHIVVIDALRACVTACSILDSGAEAVRVVTNASEYDGLVVGEDNGERLDGAVADNSPTDIYLMEPWDWDEVGLCTTNGASAVEAASASERMWLCCLPNVEAVAAELSGASEVCIVPAGRHGEPAVEDDYTARRLVEELRNQTIVAGGSLSVFVGSDTGQYLAESSRMTDVLFSALAHIDVVPAGRYKTFVAV